MKQVDLIKNYCYPIDYTVDYDKLYNSILVLLDRLQLDINDINRRCLSEFAFTVNLTHKPGIKGADRWKLHSGGHLSLVRAGVNEVDFVEHLEEMSDLYIGQVLKDIYSQHSGSQFQGRAQLIWLGAGQRYPMHRDPHTPNRYHIPVITNQLCYWVLSESGQDPVTLHMPADGRVWYLNPVKLYHTFVNDSDMARMHILLTSGF